MTSEDKRKHERIQSLNLSYVCLDQDNNVVKQAMGRTLNISESGILLETHFAIEADHTVLLTVSLAENLLDITGKPIHTRLNEDGKYEVGIEFTEIDQDSIKILKQFIGEGGMDQPPVAEEDE